MPEEQRRHRCEVTEWIKRRVAKGPEEGRKWLQGVLKDIERIRGKRAAERLRNDIAEQWKLGNRGEGWREPA